MTRRSLVFIAAIALAVQPARAQQDAVQIEKLLATAQHKATVDGDLRGAIETYRQILAGAESNRALAAQALVRMAECYQKLGNDEARRIYEQVLRDYADQREAVTLARARLGAQAVPARQAVVKGDRVVWPGPDADGFGTVSPDGRFLSFIDWNNGNLMLRDLEAGTNRRLSHGWSDYSTISRDGRQIAYGHSPEGLSRAELRVADLQGTAVPQFRRLFEPEDIRSIRPYDWSPDGKWIAALMMRQDRTGQVALVATEDRAVRVLKSVGWSQPSRIVFSADGRFVAYDLSVDDTSDERHVFLMATDGSRESLVVEHASRNHVMGWSPDGRHLLFASDRTGALALWGLCRSRTQAPKGPPRCCDWTSGRPGRWECRRPDRSSCGSSRARRWCE